MFPSSISETISSGGEEMPNTRRGWGLGSIWTRFITKLNVSLQTTQFTKFKKKNLKKRGGEGWGGGEGGCLQQVPQEVTRFRVPD